MLYLRLIPYEASLLLTLLCLRVAWRRRQLPGSELLVASLLSQALYLIGYLGELLSTTIESKIIWDNLQWLPCLSLLLLRTLFVRAYTGGKRLPAWLLLHLGSLPIVMMVLAFTNPWHHYIGANHRLIPGWPTDALFYEYGMVSWLTIPYTLGLYALSIGSMLAFVQQQRPGPLRRQAQCILGSQLVPLFTMVFAVGNITIFGYRDIMPLGLLVGTAILMWTLIKHRSPRLVPMAREMVFAHMQVGVLVVDEQRTIVDANQAAATLLGTTTASLLGQPLEQKLGSWHEVLPSLRSKESARLMVQQDGGRWLQIDIQPVKDASQQGWLLLLADISEQKKATQEAHLSREAALEASRAKSRFVATLSHEIRTPLAAVMGISRLIGETQLDPGQHDLLRKLDGATRHLLELLNHTLDFSKLEAGRLMLSPVDFSLGALMTSLGEIFWLSASDKGLQFSLTAAPNVPEKLYGDGLRLKQILVNLLGNAIKFTDRGRVSLHIECLDTPGEHVMLLFSVQDTGIGLNPEQQASLFQPFSQADPTITRRYGGTGLGLSISRQLAQLFGGELTCESQKGIGSIFRLRVRFQVHDVKPSAAPNAESSQESAPVLSKPPSETSPRPSARSLSGNSPSGSQADSGQNIERPRILLAEDNQVNQVVTQKMLRRIGYDCEIAGTGREALQLLHSHPLDYYCAVLMDLQMPDLDGKETVVQIRADVRYDALPVIALTGESVSDVVLDALSCGMDDVMQKPVDLKTLSKTIATALKIKRRESIPRLPLYQPK